MSDQESFITKLIYFLESKTSCEQTPWPEWRSNFLSLKLKFEVLWVKVVDADIAIFSTTAVAEKKDGQGLVRCLLWQEQACGAVAWEG
jgi:hypothetical protein